MAWRRFYAARTNLCYIAGKGDTTEGIKCSGGQMPRDCVWRRTWSIP